MQPTSQLPTEPAASRPEAGGADAAVTLAAMASAAAGLVHAAAAGSHNGDTTLALLFAVAAALQLGWAGLAMTVRRRDVLVGGALLNAGMVALWALSRTAGWPVVSSLSAREPVGTQDLLAAALATLAVAAAVGAVLDRATQSPAAGPSRSRIPAAAGAALLAVAVVGMSVGHTHGPSHDHAHGHGDPEADEVVAAGSDHGHDDGHGTGDDVHVEEAHHASGPVVSLDDPRVTDQQRVAAGQLIDATARAMARYPDIDSVRNAGYVSIGDGITGYEHFVHVGHLLDSSSVLDPERVESIVARVHPDGTKEIVSAMYILPPGHTMADVPDIAGELTTWHDHQNLCWEGIRVVGTLQADGSCPRGAFRPTPPMLHVWLVEHPCGPFAGIEGGGHGASCAHDH